MMDFERREEFLSLTVKALGEEDPDRFVECLLKRESYIGSLLEDGPHVFGGEIEACLQKEREILNRLEAEKKRIVQALDDLSIKKRAFRAYSPRFPLPPMPAFFKVTG